MANSDPLPAGHHVARACLRRSYQDGVVLPAAFALRERDRGRLSTDWVECPYAPASERDQDGARRRMSAALNLRTSEPVTILPVNRVRACAVDDHRLDAVEDWSGRNQCHTAIVGFAVPGNGTELLLQSLLAQAVVAVVT